MGSKRHRVGLTEESFSVVDEYAENHSITLVEAAHKLILKNSEKK